ncbi:MAG: peroxiredoxin [Candidatus Yonathbacteria bacterium CG_4_10_14_3_um_filter_47_65]|uniref:Peroxiredoxin n=2 Tax=Parcubacteria group TaxID=1794811 RepID=A0A2M8D6M4_9BACT|nr:MAG: peroxiredoxin [Candidatus Yonathbacteria bacterium CG23_combo_of_CG06-09_8_20_14_all_46_18]PIQ32245.1 MAG: peroxiredoxin [Candidatus Yonathbacteria bacterium CG17_big_fil_post_rev_8_21_14_2_50_46_19]PIX56708.1 MAG: peroxiredoxin [Candidatus Yonathbacteria bacterium CG_4_10_14_3_um_filter_47_65]PIY57901.1 MAG: peroxiredoxin [Candidatus Yonathbacteria bacterium CG_4_10_14_0_8_um_filter_47_645]PJB82529.1 MAG: peroxiredoxin [Candidatus Yonathbacteria bacterium CG_4_9_14_0_8_um_filter_46_47]
MCGNCTGACDGCGAHDQWGEYTIEIGDTVPDMDLSAYHNDEEKKINLSDYRGKWLILFFYPKDFTFVCPTELEEMQNYYGKFQKEGAEILSISTDTIEVHKAWHDTSEAIGKVTYPMIADRTGELSKMFGTYIYEEGVSLRGTFLIDPEGVLKSLEINHNDIGRSAAELYRKLQAAKYVSEHAGHVCPASWKPGDDDLEPGLDLVGKI